jgi:polar amino acid transport system substrate-binding protein
MKKLAMLFAATMVAMVLTAGAAMAGTLDDIAKRGKLRVGMEPGYMPFELTNQKGAAGSCEIP